MNLHPKIRINTKYKNYLGDLYTPIGIYLRLRDRYRDTILLESAGNQSAENNFSFIGVNAIAGIEMKGSQEIEIKFPNENPKQYSLKNTQLTDILEQFSACFIPETSPHPLVSVAQGLYGYISYEAIQFFNNLKCKPPTPETSIPLMRYRLYQYVIAINHFNDEMSIFENKIKGVESDFSRLESFIHQKNAPVYPFEIKGEERSNLTDEEMAELIEIAKKHTRRGDVFQLVLSRRFEQGFTGDELNVYRALRNINPSPYLFYFDYGDYKIFGSSPESQLIIKNKTAVIHPIAGTFKRTENIEADLAAAESLRNDPKENAEHTMLVDLARNDLSILGKNTRVSKLKEIHFFSHVIHMVSEVAADVEPGTNTFEMIGTTFPQGTLSGAPKYMALKLIDQYEKTSRSYYGGCIGFVGFNGDCNQAIMIRTFLSKRNTLYYQAGAGIVAKSDTQSEVQEIKNKLNALKSALEKATKIK
ncbi:anthranilate synthase component I family protein [Elizabethkingia argentiflava]|uniref:Anthranilate synthase component 1 n=1 Tax=Elizabethkingia argenteiflava TaxID=2681556 RepID=A0A845PVF0_9FLAO|nr:anthranilate synthase component I family protein [Elizabethkingia argenteiflava]NAW50268.1 anthranilate synthase component I family protein [Elizabethkingia argenteiflava]